MIDENPIKNPYDIQELFNLHYSNVAGEAVVITLNPAGAVMTFQVSKAPSVTISASGLELLDGLQSAAKQHKSTL